jgi:tetratricopeptide (TPR) repeat protein
MSKAAQAPAGAARDGRAQARSASGRPRPDRVRELEEQRTFLLRSLDDLDREYAAGDVDETDYQALKDDYTARAAAVHRAIEAGKETEADEEPARNVPRLVLVVAGVVLFAVVAGVVIAANYGTRTNRDSTTATEADTAREKIAQAQQLEVQGDVAGAAALYDEVLATDPENVDALTYKGWLLVRAELYDDGYALLDEAIAVAPDAAPAHVFKAVGLRNQGRAEEALAELDAVDEAQLSSFAGLVQNLRAELEAEVGQGPASPP